MLKNPEDTFDEASQKYINSAYDSFINTLNRIETEPTKSMLAGREFERLVSDVVNGKDVNHVWLDGATQIAGIIRQDNHFEQVKLFKEVTISDLNYLLYGVLDWFGSGHIYDVKFTENIGNYDVGKYFDNTQHRMYFALTYGADEFAYLISNGHKVYTETYRRDECRPIEVTIVEFAKWLKSYNLWDIYAEKWQTKMK